MSEEEQKYYRPMGPGAKAREGKYTRQECVWVDRSDDDPANPKEGSLRWAVEEVEGDRHVRFCIPDDPTIALKDQLRIRRGRLTLDGSDQPNVIIKDGNVSLVDVRDVILRHVRVAVGSRIRDDVLAGRREKPQDGIRVERCEDVMIDHCTVMWSWDEGISVDGSRRVTVQNCLVAEPLDDVDPDDPDHAHAGRALGDDVLFVRNVFAFFRRRSPRIATQEKKDDPPTRAGAVNNLSAGYAAEATIVEASREGPVKALLRDNLYRNPDLSSPPPAIRIERKEGARLQVRLDGNRFERAPGKLERITERSRWLLLKGLELNTKDGEDDQMGAGDGFDLTLTGVNPVSADKLPGILLGESVEGAGAVPWCRLDREKDVIRRVGRVWDTSRLDPFVVSKGGD